ncbi:MAG: PKD domain-containing protein [FCB group bacterium]|nr:PKD domain-containing protein [FCB group bacterium]
MFKTSFYSLISAVLFVTTISLAQDMSSSHESAFLVTYGSGADIAEGDDDFKQIIFISLPENLTDSLYLRIFDPDCGGSQDSRYGADWDVDTRYRLYGGAGAFSGLTPRFPIIENLKLSAGNLLADTTIADAPLLDNRWYNFAKFSPAAGEKADGRHYFKFIVEGLSGNDANVFDLNISLHPKRNSPPKGLKLFSYDPTVRLPAFGIIGEIKIEIPEDNYDLSVFNFDGAGASIAVETAFRSGLTIQPSGQGVWAESQVILEKNEITRPCAIYFEGGMEMPNDATFYLTGAKGECLPLYLPVYMHQANNRPHAMFTYRSLSTPREVMFDASMSSDDDGNPIDFFWDFGDGTTGTGSRVIHRYPSGGSFQAELIVTDASGTVGNSAMKISTVTLNESPVAVAGPDQIGVPGEVLNFDAMQSYDNDGEITKYVWDFRDGKRSKDAVVSHSFKKAGRYNVLLRAIDDSYTPNNFGLDSLEVWINAPPVVEIGDDIICSPHEAIEFDGSNYFDSDGNIVNFTWDFGDGHQQSGRTLNHAYDSPGTYIAKLTIEDDAGTGNSISFDDKEVFVNDRPDAHASIPRDMVAIDDVVKFDGTGSVDRDGKLIRYSWDFGDGNSGKGKSDKHKYAASGTYMVVLTVQDNSTSSTDTHTDTLTIRINYPPIAEAGPEQLTTTSEVRFDAGRSTDRDGKLIEYGWDFGDGYTSDEINPVHTYAATGEYEVTLTVRDDSDTRTESDTDKTRVTINSAPVADAGPELVGSPGEELTFDGSQSADTDGKINAFEWDFGDGNKAAGEIVKHAYQRSGIYTATLTVRDNTSHDLAKGFDVKTVYVNYSPTAIPGMNLLVAPGDEITLDGSKSIDPDGEIVTYRWDFGLNEEPVEKAVVKKSYSEPGFYSAALTVVDNSGALNCEDQAKILIHVNHEPQSKPGQDVLTNKLTVKFSGTASADPDGDNLTYSWDFGDGSEPGSGAEILHTYKEFGVYPVILTVDDETGLANATNSAAIMVTLNRPPAASAGEDKIVSAGDVVLFDGGGSTDLEAGRLHFQWDFGDGTKAEGVNPVKTFTGGGVYLVILRVQDDSGLPENISTDELVVRVAESPVADAGPDQIVSVNSEVYFDGSKSTDIDGMVNSFMWDFGDGFTGGGPTPSHVYSEPGKFIVTLKVIGDQILEEGKNEDSDKVIVTVLDAPRAKFTYPYRAAVGSMVIFDGSDSECSTDSIVGYHWDFGDSSFGEGTIAEHIYREFGRYIVTLTVKTGSEVETNTGSTKKLIVVNDPPIAEAGPDQLIGRDEMVLLDGSASKDADGIVSLYHWDFGDGDDAEGIQVRHRYQTSGIFPVALRVQDDTELENNWDTDSLLITVNSAPVPVITVNPRGSAEEEINFSGAESFDDDGEIYEMFWNFGDGNFGTGREVAHVYQKPGRYQVTLMVTDGQLVENSIADTMMQIIINAPPSVSAGDDRSASPGEEIRFDAGLSADSDGSIIDYFWDFGDMKSGQGKTVVHDFANPGKYKVKLRITDDSGTRSAITEDYCMIKVNAPPVAVAGDDRMAYFGGAHDDVIFDGSASYDPDKGPLKYEWDFGDGGKAAGPKVSHTYSKAGKYIVKLKVTDSSGTSSAVSWDELEVNVIPHNTPSKKRER